MENINQLSINNNNKNNSFEEILNIYKNSKFNIINNNNNNNNNNNINKTRNYLFDSGSIKFSINRYYNIDEDDGVNGGIAGGIISEFENYRRDMYGIRHTFNDDNSFLEAYRIGTDIIYNGISRFLNKSGIDIGYYNYNNRREIKPPTIPIKSKSKINSTKKYNNSKNDEFYHINNININTNIVNDKRPIYNNIFKSPKPQSNLNQIKRKYEDIQINNSIDEAIVPNNKNNIRINNNNNIRSNRNTQECADIEDDVDIEGIEEINDGFKNNIEPVYKKRNLSSNFKEDSIKKSNKTNMNGSLSSQTICKGSKGKVFTRESVEVLYNLVVIFDKDIQAMLKFKPFNDGSFTERQLYDKVRLLRRTREIPSNPSEEELGQAKIELGLSYDTDIECYKTPPKKHSGRPPKSLFDISFIKGISSQIVNINENSNDNDEVDDEDDDDNDEDEGINEIDENNEDSINEIIKTSDNEDSYISNINNNDHNENNNYNNNNNNNINIDNNDNINNKKPMEKSILIEQNEEKLSIEYSNISIKYSNDQSNKELIDESKDKIILIDDGANIHVRQ